jgi:hypothetical protein
VCHDYDCNSHHATEVIIRRPNGVIDFNDDRSFKKGKEVDAAAYAMKQYKLRNERTRKSA